MSKMKHKPKKVHLHPFFGIPCHQAKLSAADFVEGKMPAIVKRANKSGHMVTLTISN